MISLESFIFYLILSLSMNGFLPEQQAIADSQQEYDCPDLMIQDLKVVERKRKFLRVQYTLKNVGTEAAALKKIKSLKSKKIGIRFHFSGNQVLSPGDILADGAYIPKHQIPKNGLLPADSSLIGVAKVSLAKKNSFNNYLIAKIDPFSVLIECNEVNNSDFLLLR